MSSFSSSKPLFPVLPVIKDTEIFVRLKPLEPHDFCTSFFDERKSSFREGELLSLAACTTSGDVIPLKGFIFHLSHCGSTLLAQMLANLPQNRVISEAEVLNSILLQSVFVDMPEQKTAELLKKAIALLLQPVSGKEQNGFIKFTSWNLFHVQLIRSLYPEVPCIFLCRNPFQIIQSLKKEYNGFASWHQHTAPVLASHYLGVPPSEVKEMDDDDYLARMLIRHMEFATEYLRHKTYAAEYPQWIDNFAGQLLPFLQMNFTAEEVHLMTERTLHDAKKSAILFNEHETTATNKNNNTVHKALTDSYLRLKQEMNCA